jgi:hypothetical protein
MLKLDEASVGEKKEILEDLKDDFNQCSNIIQVMQ